MTKKIIATFHGDHTGFTRDFDVTDVILKMDLIEVKNLEDNQVKTDHLSPEELIEEAKIVFRDEWGKGSKNLKFGYYVEIEQSILSYFNIENLQDLKKDNFKRQV